MQKTDAPQRRTIYTDALALFTTSGGLLTLAQLVSLEKDNSFHATLCWVLLRYKASTLCQYGELVKMIP